jgi:hypothetical protein
MAKAVYCPNLACSQHKNPKPENLIKKGMATGFKGKTYQRFLCKICGYKFNERKLKWDANFRKQNRISETHIRYTGGTNIQRLAEDIDVDKKLVLKIISFLGPKIKVYHYYQIDQGLIKSDNVAFDESEHYVHGRNYPVSFGIAYSADGEKIIDVGVADILLKSRRKTKIINYHKKKKIKLPRKFFSRKDTSKEMCEAIFQVIKKCVGTNPNITTDGKTAYRTLARKILPEAVHHEVISHASRVKKKDPTKRPYHKKKLLPAGPEHKLAMNRLNSVASYFRRHIPGLARKSQITFKTNKSLENALYMGLARYNGYDLQAILKFQPALKKPKAKITKKKK